MLLGSHCPLFFFALSIYASHRECESVKATPCGSAIELWCQIQDRAKLTSDFLGNGRCPLAPASETAPMARPQSASQRLTPCSMLAVPAASA